MSDLGRSISSPTSSRAAAAAAATAVRRAERRPVRLALDALGVLTCVASVLFMGYAASAQDSPSADEIAKRVVNGGSFRWSGAQSRVRMVLIEGDGKKKERAMDVVGRDKDGHYQSLVRFLSPEDIAGTAFLMLEKGKDSAEQYIYLPGIKRTRRIAGRERDGGFMGSDFTYSDLAPADPAEATHKKLPDESVGSDACYVLESTFQAGKGSYGKVQIWVRKNDYVALRTRFYDRAGKLVKTLYARRVKNFENKPVVVEARMQTQATNHATELFVDSLEKRDGLADSQFTPEALEHL